MTKAILFDFDGTIANTAPGIVKTMEHTFMEMGITVPSEEAMRATIGLRLDLALKQLGELNDNDAEIATETYRRLFPIYEVNYVSIFPGIKETLAELQQQGVRLAICTSRDAKSLDMICEHHGIKDFFETRVTNNDHLAPKPAPDLVLALLNKMQLQKEEVLVVGDTTFDIEMGNRAGCNTVAVTWGNHSRQQLKEALPTFIIDNIEQITDSTFVSSHLLQFHGVKEMRS